MQVILETGFNCGRNSLRVESRRVSKKSRALRNFLGTPDNVSGELETWYAQVDRRVEFLRQKFAHLLEQR